MSRVTLTVEGGMYLMELVEVHLSWPYNTIIEKIYIVSILGK